MKEVSSPGLSQTFPATYDASLTIAACAVKEARRLRTIHIVRLEWLEDSLLSKSRRPLDTQKYQYERRKMLKKSRPRNSPQQAKEPAQDSSDESSARLREVSSRKDKLKNLKAKKEGTLRGEGLTKSEKLEISGRRLCGRQETRKF